MHRKVHVRFGPGATGKGSANRYLASGLPVLTASHAKAPPGTEPRPVTLWITARDAELLIRVWDPDPAPRPLHQPLADPLTENGRGLCIGVALSHRWGTHPAPNGGKYVWSILPLSPQPPPA